MERQREVIQLSLIYGLQGVLMGIFSAFEFFLPDLWYTQAIRLASALKLFWAPVIDAVYIPGFRRMTWIVIMPLLFGGLLIYMSWYPLLDTVSLPPNRRPDGLKLFGIAAMLSLAYFLVVTQDIAVDGWSLQVTSNGNTRNCSLLSICSNVSYSIGSILGESVFLALESPQFCNGWLRSVPRSKGLVTVTGFLWFWGISSLVVTFFLMFTMHEHVPNIGSIRVAAPRMMVNAGRRQTTAVGGNGTVRGIYQELMMMVATLPTLRRLLVSLLFLKVGFCVHGSLVMTIISNGVPRELISFVTKTTEIAVPFFIRGMFCKELKKLPLTLATRAAYLRHFLEMSLVFVAYFQASLPSFIMYLLLLSSLAFYQMMVTMMGISLAAFFNMIADEQIGGSYITMLHSVNNAGGMWPTYVVRLLSPLLDWSGCNIPGHGCLRMKPDSQCLPPFETCTLMPGIYYLTLACVTAGLLCYCAYRDGFVELETTRLNAWTITRKRVRRGH